MSNVRLCLNCEEPIEDYRRKDYCSDWCRKEKRYHSKTDDTDEPYIDVKLRNSEDYGLKAKDIFRRKI